VTGVVPDVVSGLLFRGKDETAVYFPAAAGQSKIQSAMIRVNGNPAAAVESIRRVCASTRNTSGCEPVKMREISGMWRFPFETAASVAGALGTLAMALTTIGLYSVTRYSVVHRRREIGVRIALGASPARVMRSILGEAWRCVAAGLAVGLPLCLILSRLLSSSVFGIHAFDTRTYGMIPLMLGAIVTLACAAPAYRAARRDPMDSLKEE
jgi:ABC-type antimicrobial peptide transport system permease subunit